MYLIGGYIPQIDGSGAKVKMPNNEIYRSMDGTKWELVSMDDKFRPRYGHSSIYFNDSIMI